MTAVSSPSTSPSGARVIDATTGNRVTTGRATLDSPSGASYTSPISPDGTMRFAADVTAGQLIIDAPGYQRYVHPFDSRERPWPSEFRLERAPQTPYAGQVVDGITGAPVTRGKVTWESANSPDVSIQIASQGAFRIEVPIASDVAPGRVMINAPGYEPQARSVEVRRGQPTAEFRLVALPPTPTSTPIPPPLTLTPSSTPTPTPTLTPTLTRTLTPDPILTTPGADLD